MLATKTFLKFLRRNKLYTLVTIGGFSIAMMFVIILSIYVSNELSVDNFHKNKDRIVLMTHDKSSTFGNTVPAFVKEKCPEIESFTRIYFTNNSTIKLSNGTNISSKTLYADSTFFDIFSFKLIDGQLSNVLNRENTVVLTKEYAFKIFGNENPVGKSLSINKRPHFITGIMENILENTQLPQTEMVVNYNSIRDLWGGEDYILNNSNNFGFPAYYLIKEGADINSKKELLLNLFKEEFWYYKNGFTNDLEFIPLEKAYFESEKTGNAFLKTNSKTQIQIYEGIVILILIVTLFNYINLTTAQAGSRAKEAAIRKLVGSSRRRIAIQLLTESLFITFAAIIPALFAAIYLEPFFNDILHTQLNIKHLLTIENICIAVISIFILALIAGIIPATIISKFNPIEIVKGTYSYKIKSSWSKNLIIFQYIIAITMVICSFLIQKQFNFLINKDLGFKKEGILSLSNTLGAEQLPGLKDKLQSISGVETIFYTCGSPVDGSNNMSYEVNGVQYSFQEMYVDSEFFDILGIAFQPTGIPTIGENIYWTNKKGYLAMGTDTVTQQVAPEHGDFRIAGILNDFHYKPLYYDIDLLRIRLRRPNEWPWQIIVKISGSNNLKETVDRIKQSYLEYNGNEPFTMNFADDRTQSWYAEVEKTSKLIQFFSMLTLAIMTMGVFAMSLYLIRQKEKEVALRKINGATEWQILRLLNTDTLIRLMIAFVIACPISYYAITKWLNSFSYKTSIDWYYFVLLGAIVAFWSLVTISWQTWHATTKNPAEILK